MSMQPKRSARGEDFGHQAMPNLSCRCTVRYTIYFASGDICFVRTTIDYCELAHSRRGKRWLALVCRVELSQLCKSPRPNFVNVTTPRTYNRHRFPPDNIQYAVGASFRFTLSHRDIEDLLAQRGIDI